MNIDPQNQRIIRAMVFQDKDQEADFFKCWQSHLQGIFLNHNPENLSKEELSKIYWTPFQIKHWDWEKHVYKPFVEEAPPQIPWKISLNCETGFKHEIYDEERREWIKVKR
jgi:hypothetical protein